MTEPEVPKTLEAAIVETVLRHHPDVQAIYLFFGFGTPDGQPGSEVDVALLLPPLKSGIHHLALSGIAGDLENRIGTWIDVVNLRRAETSVQQAVVKTDRRIFTGDRYATEEFEVFAISYHLHSIEERTETIGDGPENRDVFRKTSDVMTSRKVNIERCIREIRDYYDLLVNAPFERDILRQDAVAFHFECACQQCIDMANHMIAIRKLGVPKESHESFRLLVGEGILPQDLARRLRNMVGFRNFLVRHPQRREAYFASMVRVIEENLDDLFDFTNHLIAALPAEK